MDNKLIDVILVKIDRLEEKVDRLLEFKWKIVGGTILASLILTGAFQLCLALIHYV